MRTASSSHLSADLPLSEGTPEGHRFEDLTLQELSLCQKRADPDIALLKCNCVLEIGWDICSFSSISAIMQPLRTGRNSNKEAHSVF